MNWLSLLWHKLFSSPKPKALPPAPVPTDAWVSNLQSKLNEIEQKRQERERNALSEQTRQKIHHNLSVFLKSDSFVELFVEDVIKNDTLTLIRLVQVGVESDFKSSEIFPHIQDYFTKCGLGHVLKETGKDSDHFFLKTQELKKHLLSFNTRTLDTNYPDAVVPNSTGIYR